MRFAAWFSPRSGGDGIGVSSGNATRAGWLDVSRPLRLLPRWMAWAVLAFTIMAMAWSALAAVSAPPVAPADAAAVTDGDGGDLALYARISERVAAGENYYAAAMEEQRAADYPTRPFVTVRLPTLAWLHRWVGQPGVRLAIALALPAAILLLMARLETLTAPAERFGAGAAMLLGGVAAVIPDAALIHEVAAGVMLSLAFAVYRPRRWWPALIPAALALAVRELAAPFVMLWFAFAVIRRDWREAAAVAGLLALFAIALWLHHLGVAAHALPGDRPSPGWNATAGPELPIMALSRLTALLVLPPWLAAPLVVLPLLGWLGLGGRAGYFAFTWSAGFLAAMSLFARPENFYWAQLILPAYCAGFAFVPRAAADLLSAARGPASSHP
ncbi:hypothetical protein [Aurantiacibacter spongiae]|uniref:DUF2029 domain-containing protein n=1 Tax=Aurantiacibacter spongiae TaxID=2488860 RepID=A0A3N5CYR0_9SPHN|nr:hypothetical protein [Aurantiacibacter spongiae]RPF71839.1 hypothetical protein EG799_09560 [Aurantiacibacter spongiae]